MGVTSPVAWRSAEDQTFDVLVTGSGSGLVEYSADYESPTPDGSGTVTFTSGSYLNFTGSSVETMTLTAADLSLSSEVVGASTNLVFRTSDSGNS